MSQPPIEDGAVAIDGDTIIAVGPAKDVQTQHSGEVRDLGEVALAPGLINSHCHLDYTDMINQVEWRGSFIEWILQLVALKKLQTEKQYVAAIRNGVQQLLKSGATTVVNIESFPSLIDEVGPTPLRIVWCLELMDHNRSEPPKDIAQQALEFIAARPSVFGGFGLSPHALYTTSAELYELSGRYAQARAIPLTTHVAESQEEDDMIRRGTGHMYDYFMRAGRDMSDCKRVGPVQLMSERGVLGSHCLAVHANCLTPLDVKLLAQTGTHVVHCTRTHRFFGRGTPLLDPLWAAGVNICLGTDSLASNDTLDMFAEMQTLSMAFPRLAPEQILAMATTCAAKALNLPDKLGRIAPGAWADLIAVPLDDAVADPLEAVVFTEKPVMFSMIAGNVVADGEG